jgi:hypothetical protein
MDNWTWDVRNTVNNADDPAYKAIYDRINGMCYLLEFTTYGELFDGTVLDITNKLVGRMQTADSSLFSSSDKVEVARARDDIANLLSSESKTTLTIRNLYEAQGNDAIPQVLYDIFSELQTAVPKLCLPFIALRRSGKLIDAAALDRMLQGFGSHTQLQLYTEPRESATPEARKALREAFSAKLLDSKYNDKLWNEVRQECAPDPAQFCSTTATGAPTLACTGLSLQK